MKTGLQWGPERLADHFINYLFTSDYADNRHVRRVASWIGLIVLAIDRIADERGQRYKRQLQFTFGARTFKVRYRHPREVPPRGGVQIVEMLSSPGNPDGDIVVAMSNLREAEEFYKNAEVILHRFIHP